MTSVSSYISVHIPELSAQCRSRKTLVFSASQFSRPSCFSSLKQNSSILRIQVMPIVHRRRRSLLVVRAAQSNLIREDVMHFSNEVVIDQSISNLLFACFYVVFFGSMFEVGKDGIEAGTNLVPNSVPRPLARISVTVVALSLALFVLKSFLSTAFFVLEVVGGGNKDYTSTEDSLEEARRIMDKYK
ncbi:unnamed protein product [Rhodiola kirilowii]